MNVPARTQTGADVIESVIAKGDLSKLTVEQRNEYYFRVCEATGLSPITQPFAYITLNGKLTLYASVTPPINPQAQWRLDRGNQPQGQRRRADCARQGNRQSGPLR